MKEERLWVVLSKDLRFLGFRRGTEHWSQFDSMATGGMSIFTEEIGYWVDTTMHPGIHMLNPHTHEWFELVGKELKKEAKLS